mgnify:CR=1 FL=1
MSSTTTWPGDWLRGVLEMAVLRVLANEPSSYGCLLYTSDAADERSSVDLGGRRIIKKKKKDREKRAAIKKQIEDLKKINTRCREYKSMQ